MLIRQKRQPKSQFEHFLNREVSSEGKARFAEGEKLQAKVQGGLSDLVRANNGVLSDEQMKDWHDSLNSPEYSGKKPASRRQSTIKRVGVIVDGEYVSVDDSVKGRMFDENGKKR